jgi:hypothetical protein
MSLTALYSSVIFAAKVAAAKVAIATFRAYKYAKRRQHQVSVCSNTHYGVMMMYICAHSSSVNAHADHDVPFCIQLSQIDKVEWVEEFNQAMNLHVDLLCVNEMKRQKDEWKSFGLSPTEHIEGGKKKYDYACKLREQAVLNEKMELSTFPWDIQDLSIHVTINEPAHAFIIVPNEEYPPVFQRANFPLSDVFDTPLEDIVIACPHESPPSESSRGITYPRCTFKIYLIRKGGFYLSNVIVPMAVLTMLTMASCSIEPSGEPLSTGDRLSVTLTLLLTAVAYKFVVASSLPQVR